MSLRTLVVPAALVGTLFFLSQCGSKNTTDNSADTGVTSGVVSGAGGSTGSGGAAATPTSTTSTSTSLSTSTSTSLSSSTSAANNTTATSTSAGTTSSTVATSAGGSSTSGTTASSVGGAQSVSTDSTADSTSGGGSMGTTGAGGTGSMGGDFVLTSSELEDGGMFMDKSTCALNGFDNDESPPFAWSGAPAGTQSFALVLLDVTLTDQGNMNGYHWAMWDIPASVSSLPGNLPSGATITDPVSAKQYNPLSASYLGPCPNVGGGSNTDTYEFTLYAMPDAETTSLAGLNNVQQLDTAIKAVAIGSATLSGTSNASPP